MKQKAVIIKNLGIQSSLDLPIYTLHYTNPYNEYYEHVIGNWILLSNSSSDSFKPEIVVIK